MKLDLQVSETCVKQNLIYNLQVVTFFVEPAFEVVQVEVCNDNDDGKGGQCEHNLFNKKRNLSLQFSSYFKGQFKIYMKILRHFFTPPTHPDSPRPNKIVFPK